jgi:CelD/BcsL family acetyltransferase involved in cellulose biosynthesis
MPDRRASSRFETFSIPLSDEGGIDDAWAELAARTKAPAWSWPGWFHAWQRAFSPDRPLVVYGARAGSRLAALGVFRRHGTRMRSAANAHSPWFTVLADGPESRRAVFGAVLGDRPAQLELARLQGHGDDEHALLEEAAAHGYRVLRTHLERAPFVLVDRDWTSYSRTHPGAKEIKDLRRRGRRLAELGSVSFEWLAPDPGTVDRLLADGLGVEASGWKHRAGSSILSTPALTTFYKDIGRWAAERGWLRLGFIRLDNRPVAFDYALESHGLIALLKGGYVEELARVGPGILLLHNELERAFAANVDEIDLLGGSEPYKLRWACGTRPSLSLAAFAPGPVGLGALASRRATLQARRTARRAIPTAWLRRIRGIPR